MTDSGITLSKRPHRRAIGLLLVAAMVLILPMVAASAEQDKEQQPAEQEDKHRTDQALFLSTWAYSSSTGVDRPKMVTVTFRVVFSSFTSSTFPVKHATSNLSSLT